MRIPATRRSGLSLLEVIIALAVFLLSLIAISRMVDSGLDTAVEADVRAQASFRAQSVLAELTAGALPLNAQGETPFEDDGDWVWSVDVQPDSIPGLYQAQVKVARGIPGGRIEVRLAQLILDPAIRGSTDSSTLGTDDTTGTGSTTPSGTTTGGAP